jgi:hypothetical protein
MRYSLLPTKTKGVFRERSAPPMRRVTLRNEWRRSAVQLAQASAGH